MRILRVLAVAGTTGLVAMSGGLAQSPETSQPSSEALQAARDLVALVFSPAKIPQMASAMVWPGVAAAMRSKYPKIDDATLGELRGAFERQLSEATAETMNVAPVIYARYFTAAEMKEIAAFYRTSTGAKTFRVMPKVTADIMAALLPRFQSMAMGAQFSANFSNILKKHGLAISALSTAPRLLERTIVSGERQKIGFVYWLNPDCTTAGGVTVRIITPPVRGELTTEQGVDYTNYLKEDQRYQCNLKKSPGTNIYYKSSPGYFGADTATIEYVSPKAIARTITYTITVR